MCNLHCLLQIVYCKTSWKVQNQQMDLILVVFEIMLKSHKYYQRILWLVCLLSNHHTTVALEADQDPPFHAISVWLFSPHHQFDFTPAQRNQTKQANAPEFLLTESNRLPVNTLLNTHTIRWDFYLVHLSFSFSVSFFVFLRKGKGEEFHLQLLICHLTTLLLVKSTL